MPDPISGEKYIFSQETSIATKPTKLPEGFELSEGGAFATKDFQVGNKSLTITVPLPKNISIQERDKILQRYGKDKLEVLGEIAVAAGLGIDNVVKSIGFQEGNEGIKSFHKVLEQGSIKTVEPLDRESILKALNNTTDTGKIAQLNILLKNFDKAQSIWQKTNSQASKTNTKEEEPTQQVLIKEDRRERYRNVKDLSSSQKVDKKASSETAEVAKPPKHTPPNKPRPPIPSTDEIKRQEAAAELKRAETIKQERGQSLDNLETLRQNFLKADKNLKTKINKVFTNGVNNHIAQYFRNNVNGSFEGLYKHLANLQLNGKIQWISHTPEDVSNEIKVRAEIFTELETLQKNLNTARSDYQSNVRKYFGDDVNTKKLINEFFTKNPNGSIYNLAEYIKEENKP